MRADYGDRGAPAVLRDLKGELERRQRSHHSAQVRAGTALRSPPF